MTAAWDIWKRGFDAWEGATAKYFESVLKSPLVLEPAGAALTATMKAKLAREKAIAAAWAALGLPTRRDQERILHALNQIQSRLIDIEERFEDAQAREVRAARTPRAPRPSASARPSKPAARKPRPARASANARSAPRRRDGLRASSKPGMAASASDAEE